MVNIIIAGSRTFDNYECLKKKVLNFIGEKQIELSNICIISGTARGADKMGENFAKELNLKLKCFPADWDKYGKQAGFLRNTKMANYAIEDDNQGILIAFWDGKSSGTKHMIEIAKKKELEVKIFVI